jgi:hemerythrin
MPFFEWNDRMSVGHEMIDHDHQKLIHYVNQMHEAMIVGHGKDIVGPILHSLIAYTRDHFGREETVTELQAKYAAGTVALSVDVMQFLRDWLKNHILKSDREAADAIAAMARAKAPAHA